MTNGEHCTKLSNGSVCNLYTDASIVTPVRLDSLTQVRIRGNEITYTEYFPHCTDFHERSGSYQYCRTCLVFENDDIKHKALFRCPVVYIANTETEILQKSVPRVYTFCSKTTSRPTLE